MLGQNNTISTKRLVRASSKDTYASTYTLEDVACYLERADASVVAAFGGENAFTSYVCILDGVQDVQISDLVIDKNSNEYIVQGVRHFENNIDIENHTELELYQRFPNT